MAALKLSLSLLALVFLSSCKTCDQAWNEYKRSIEKKRLFGACTLNYDCVAVKELPNFVFTSRGMTLFEQEKIDGLREEARRICYDSSRIKSQDDKSIKASVKATEFKERPSEPCCVDGQCILAYPGSCNLKVNAADRKIMDKNQKLIEQATVKFKFGDYKKAIKLLERRKMKAEQREQQTLLIGLSLFKMQDYTGSVKWLTEAANLAATDAAASYFLICAAIKTGKNDLIRPNLDKITSKAGAKRETADDFVRKFSSDQCFDRIRNDAYFQKSLRALEDRAARG